MMSARDKVIAALLRLMRKRRTSLAGQFEREIAPTDTTISVKRREAQFSDFEAVTKLKQRWGLRKDSLENWYRLWRDNAAVGLAKSPLSMGWVLESEGRVVGYQGSVPLVYYYGRRALLAAAGTSLVVEPAYRAGCISLEASFYGQKDVELFLMSTAVPAVGKLSKLLQAEALPQRDYDTVLLWILNARQFVNAAVKKFGMDNGIGKLAEPVALLAVKTDLNLWRRPPARIPCKFPVVEIQVNDIGHEFELLWQRKLAEKPRLMADRSPASLRWHFTIPGGPKAIVYCCHRGKRLAGYAIVQKTTDRETGMQRLNLVDMLVEENDSDVTESLLAAAYVSARNSDSHVFEVLGFPRTVREILLRWRPYSRKYPACPFFYKVRDQSLRRNLVDEDSWHVCPFDDDTTLMP